MLSIARALLTNPTILLMDEPTEGLAPILVDSLTAVLKQLRTESGLSIVLVEQNSRVALSFSPRTVILDKGRIVYDGNPNRCNKMRTAWPSWSASWNDCSRARFSRILQLCSLAMPLHIPQR